MLTRALSTGPVLGPFASPCILLRSILFSPEMDLSLFKVLNAFPDPRIARHLFLPLPYTDTIRCCARPWQ